MKVERAYPCERSVSSHAWCPWCYENARSRANHRGHRGHSPRRSQKIRGDIPIGVTIKRIHASQAPKKGAWTCGDASFASNYPTLAQFLCDPWWDDGKPREVGTLSIKFGPIDVSIVVSDPEGRCSSFCTSGSLPDAFLAFEEALAAGAVSWRRWKGK